MMQVERGTRALITGASRGIGRALASELAGRGVQLGLAARSAGALESLAGALPGGPHQAIECDVGDAESVERALASFGVVDLLVANAGITHYGPFAAQPLVNAERMTRVNWLGTLYTVSAGLPGMLERGRGHIVIVSSGAALRSFPSAAVYGATKSAQRMFGEALRHELAGTGVSLTLVYPGEIATSLHDHERDTMPAWYRGGGSAAPPERLAQKIIQGIERDARSVHYPPIVRLLGALHNVSPRSSDALLRRLRGNSAAQRSD